jgi:hypothetical protein
MILWAARERSPPTHVSVMLCFESHLATAANLRRYRLNCGYCRCHLALRANEPHNKQPIDHRVSTHSGDHARSRVTVSRHYDDLQLLESVTHPRTTPKRLMKIYRPIRSTTARIPRWQVGRAAAVMAEVSLSGRRGPAPGVQSRMLT